MERLYDKSADYFSKVHKEEGDMMQTTKHLEERMRLEKEIDFTEDFRKRFLTNEYGNYEKY